MKPVKQIAWALICLLASGLLAAFVQSESANAWVPGNTPAQLGQAGAIGKTIALRDTGSIFDVPLGADEQPWETYPVTDGHVAAEGSVDNDTKRVPTRQTDLVGWEYSSISYAKPADHQQFVMTSWGRVFRPAVLADSRAFVKTSISLAPSTPFLPIDDPEEIRINDLLIPGSLESVWFGPAGAQKFKVTAIGSDFCVYQKTAGVALGHHPYGLARAPDSEADFTKWLRLPVPPYDPLTKKCVSPKYRDPFGLAALSLMRGTSASIRPDGSVVVRWLDLGAFTANEDVVNDDAAGAPQSQPVSSLALVGLGGLSSSQLVSAGVAVDAVSGLVVVSPAGQAPLVGRFVAGASSVSLVSSGGAFPGSGFPDGVAVDATKLVDSADLQIVKDATGAYLVQRGASGGTWVAHVSLPTGTGGVGASTVGWWFGLGGWAQPGSLRTFTDGTSHATQLSVIGSDGKTSWFRPLQASADGHYVPWATTVVAEDDYPVGAQFGLNPGESVLQWTQASVTGTPGGLQATGGASSLLVVQTNQRVLVGRLTSSGGSAGFVTVTGGVPTTSDGTGISVVPLPASHDYAVVLDAADGSAVELELGDGVVGACTVGVSGCSGTHTSTILTFPAQGSTQAKGLSAATRALFSSPIRVASVPQPSWDPAHGMYLWSATAVDSSGAQVSLYQLTGPGTANWGGWYTNTPETAANVGGFVSAATQAKITTAQAVADHGPTQPAPGSAVAVHSVWVRQDSVISSFTGVTLSILEVHQADTINNQVLPAAVTVTGSSYQVTPVATISSDGTVVLFGADSAPAAGKGDAHRLRYTAISSTGAVVKDQIMSNSFIVAGNADGHGDSVGAALVNASHYITTPATATATGQGGAHYVFTVATRGSDDSQLYAAGMTLDLFTTLPTTTAVTAGADPAIATSYGDSLLSTDVNSSAKVGFGGSISGAPALVSTTPNTVSIFALGYASDNTGKAWNINTQTNGIGVPVGGNWSPVGTGLPTPGGHAYRDDSLTITPITPDTPHGLFATPAYAPTATIDPATRNILTAWTGPDGTWITTLSPDANTVQYWDEQKLVGTPAYTPAILTPNTDTTYHIGALIYTPTITTITTAASVLFATTTRTYNYPVEL